MFNSFNNVSLGVMVAAFAVAFLFTVIRDLYVGSENKRLVKKEGEWIDSSKLDIGPLYQIIGRGNYRHYYWATVIVAKGTNGEEPDYWQMPKFVVFSNGVPTKEFFRQEETTGVKTIEVEHE